MEEFLRNKLALEIELIHDKVKHAPEGNLEVIYRLLGRHHPAVPLMAFGTREERSEYLALEGGDAVGGIGQSRWKDVAVLAALEGTCSEGNDLVRALKEDGQGELLEDVLLLFQALNYTFFKEEEKNWGQELIASKIMSISHAEEFPPAPVDQQIGQLLGTIRGLNMEKDCGSCFNRNPFSALKELYQSRKLTTNLSSCLPTTASPMPECPEPACTGSSAT